MDFDSGKSHSELDTENVVSFPEGIPGFEEHKEFRLFNEEGDTRLFWLRSKDDPEVEFAASTPDNLGVNYEVTLTDDEISLIKLEDPNDVAVLVTLVKDGSGIPGVHGNFLGPIFINTASRIAFQKVLANAEGVITIRA